MASTSEAALFGQGLAFPPRLGDDGRLSWAVGHRSVRESIRVILTTEPGERLMLPTFGAGLRSFLFEPNIPSTHRLIEARVQHALKRWEPRIAVDTVAVTAHRDDPALAIVAITYQLVATQASERIDLTVSVSGGRSS